MEQGVSNPGVISLAAGLVDQDSLPVDEVAQACARLMAHPALARELLQYGATPGYAPLRDLLARRLAEMDGLAPGENDLCGDRVLIGAGSQQLLYLVGEVLLDPGDVVLADAPTYFVYMGALESMDARIVPVDADDDGLVPESLEVRLDEIQRRGELDRVKFIYVVSYFNNPTGMTLSADRRKQVVEIAKRWSRASRIHVVEDAAYRELSYFGDPPPSMLRFDPDASTVLYAGTFSKPFAPGVRTGYLVAPRDLVGALVRQKGHHDFGSANLTQGLVLEVLESGAYDRHLARLRTIYGEKLRLTLNTLQDALSPLDPQVEWTRPTGGLYVWVRTPAGVSTGMDGPFFRDCLDEGVLYVPGEFCYPPGVEGAPTNFLRLSFGLADARRCREGLNRFCRVLARCAGAS
jgi:2-aminoadipate transaminase